MSKLVGQLIIILASMGLGYVALREGHTGFAIFCGVITILAFAS